ncbi:unnamed protein product [Durusdinium trenchii]|uniref:Reverse transcriptase domain-containing protein n=1 Tax=Durusdinium trenchii TaxID=1381693 RepID=A0ABP0HJB1_9DINO
MQARNLGKSLFEAIAVSGEDCIFIGDWNCTAEEEPVERLQTVLERRLRRTLRRLAELQKTDADWSLARKVLNALPYLQKHFPELTEVRKAVGKAHGPDGWTGDSWSLLPMGFFDALAKLWNVVMKTARLPYQWHSVRCVLIPKEVGLRPISIAALAWRTGIGVLAQQLAHWIDSWAPDELVGGLKGRSSATAHEQLHESIAWPKVFGAKIDIAKCFDHVDDTVTRKVSARLRRLRTATSNQRNKRKLTRSLVLSLFAHSGPWTTVSKKLLNQWRYTIEQTIIGRAVPGRSRFLLWQYLGPDLCPEFALDRRVVFHELWKVRRAVSSCRSLLDIEQVCAAMPQPSTSYRLAEVLNKWQWQHISQSRFRTPQGDLDLAFDGLPAIKEAMRHAWLAYLWRNEPRAQDDAEVCQRVLPVYQAHSAWMRQGVSDWESFCIAVGAGKDSRKLAKQHELESFNCACGREWPSRTHVTWHCPSCPGLPEASRPTRKAEERLLVPSIQLPPIPDERCSQFLRPDPNLCDLFRRTATADQGLDQNIFGAESVAVLKAFIAATHLRVDLLLVCDNLAVVRRVKQIQTTGYLPQWAPGLWKALSLEQAARSVHELLDWKFTFDAAVAWSASALDRQRSALRFLRQRFGAPGPTGPVEAAPQVLTQPEAPPLPPVLAQPEVPAQPAALTSPAQPVATLPEVLTQPEAPAQPAALTRVPTPMQAPATQPAQMQPKASPVQPAQQAQSLGTPFPHRLRASSDITLQDEAALSRGSTMVYETQPSTGMARPVPTVPEEWPDSQPDTFMDRPDELPTLQADWENWQDSQQPSSQLPVL